MDIYTISYNYESKYLLVINTSVNVYIYKKGKLDEPFISFQPTQVFVGKSKVCNMTEFSGANDDSGFDAKIFF